MIQGRTQELMEGVFLLSIPLSSPSLSLPSPSLPLSFPSPPLPSPSLNQLGVWESAVTSPPAENEFGAL